MATTPASAADEHLQVSAHTGQGLSELHAALRRLAQGDDAGEGAFTARARHVDALQLARAALAEAVEQLDHEALDLAAESLRAAHEALGEITGRVRPDDLLGHIFASFCIGK
jgi:tRNA modification GTPase